MLTTKQECSFMVINHKTSFKKLYIYTHTNSSSWLSTTSLIWQFKNISWYNFLFCQSFQHSYFCTIRVCKAVTLWSFLQDFFFIVIVYKLRSNHGHLPFMDHSLHGEGACVTQAMKLWTMLRSAIQDRWVIVKSSDKTWSTGEGNGKPCQYSCCENLTNSMKRKKMTLEDKPP